ncbi:MAG: hypothetical protein RIS70_865 [Planctomycetota bacterium]
MEDLFPPETKAGSATASKSGRWIRALSAVRRWSGTTPARSVALVLGFASVTVLIVWTAMQLSPRRALYETVELEEALARLDAGEYDEARVVAGKLFAHSGEQPEAVTGALYVFGAALVHDAMETDVPEQRRRLYLMAIRYLEEAHARGFPESRRESGLDLLARSLFEAGYYAKSLPVLREALETPGANTTEHLRLLSEAYARDANPQWEKSRDANAQFMARQDLPEADRVEGWLRQARLEFAMNQYDDCRRTLEQLPALAADRAEMLLMRAQLELHAAEELDGNEPQQSAMAEHLQNAVKLLRKAQDVDGHRDTASRKADYLLGQCLKRQGDRAAAVQQFYRTFAAHPDTPEGVAAGMAEAELRLTDGDDKSAFDTLRRVLREAGDPDAYSNPWLSLNELRQRVEAAFRQFVARRDYARAVELTREMPPLVPEVTAVRLRAEGKQAWALSALEQAGSLAYSAAAPVEAEAREHFRGAGRAFSRLARLRETSREYSEDLWNSAECFARGRDFRNATGKYRDFLMAEPRRRRVSALVALAESHLALGENRAALDALQECLEFYARDPQIYRARLVACRAHLENRDLEAAKRLLRENLDSEVLTPSSLEWRDSLFQLGLLEFEEAERLFHDPAVALLIAKPPLNNPSAPAGNPAPAAAGGNAANPPDTTPTTPTLDDVYLAYEQVVDTLGEAIARYADAGQVAAGQVDVARYRVASARQALVQLDRARLAAIALDATRDRIERKVDEQLRTVAAEMQRLREDLQQRRETTELRPLENDLLRNAFFVRANALYELKNYSAAAEELSLAVNRLPQGPVTIDAMVQMAHCFRQLTLDEEARGTLRQAQYVLRRLPADTEFAKTTPYDRAGWDQLLAWLITL